MATGCGTCLPGQRRGTDEGRKQEAVAFPAQIETPDRAWASFRSQLDTDELVEVASSNDVDDHLVGSA